MATLAPLGAAHLRNVYSLQASMYQLIGKQVRVHLYSREGITVGSITGRVADVAEGVEVSEGMKKDLVFVVDIDSGDPDAPYKNSAGMEGESWFAVQDIEVIEDDGPRLFSN
jgi:hypothetical protein